MCVGASRRRMASLHTAHARRSLVDLNRARMCRHLPIASAGTQPAAHHPRALHRLAPRHSSTCLRDKCHGKVSAVCVRACVRVARCGFAWTKALRYETAESSRGLLQIIHTPGARARSLSLSLALSLSRSLTHSLTHNKLPHPPLLVCTHIALLHPLPNTWRCLPATRNQAPPSPPLAFSIPHLHRLRLLRPLPQLARLADLWPAHRGRSRRQRQGSSHAFSTFPHAATPFPPHTGALFLFPAHARGGGGCERVCRFCRGGR